MKHNNTVYSRHILDAIAKVEQYVHGMDHNGFIANTLVQDGVIRHIEIIGEATK